MRWSEFSPSTLLRRITAKPEPSRACANMLRRLNDEGGSVYDHNAFVARWRDELEEAIDLALVSNGGGFHTGYFLTERGSEWIARNAP